MNGDHSDLCVCLVIDCGTEALDALTDLRREDAGKVVNVAGGRGQASDSLGACRREGGRGKEDGGQTEQHART